MLRDYFKIAWRNMMKNKTFSLINIAGLSVGTAACLLILQYVSFQLSFDQFNENVADLYRVVNDRYQNGQLIQHGTITYSGVGKAMKDDFPEVVNHARVEPMNTLVITYGNEKLGDRKGLAVDNAFLSMFSYPIIAGNRTSALTEPNTLVLSETLARRIFKVKDDDFESVIGKELIIDWSPVPNKITAVCKDVPENSHLTFDFLWSYVTLYSGSDPWRIADHDFTASDFWHYIQLKPGSDYAAFNAKLPAFSERHFKGSEVSGSDETFYLQPLSRAHLYSDFEYEIGNTSGATLVWGLLTVALLIIIIAWVNYINLATAKSVERAKEVGVRKVSGATQSQLIRQFLTESFLVNIVSLLIALLIVALVQDQFNHLVKHDLSLLSIFQKGLAGYTIIVLLAGIMLTGMFVSGLYPAFLLSSFKPVLVLKGRFSISLKGIALRKALVVGQFAVTIALIIGSFIIYRQIKFVNSHNLGLNLSQVLVIKAPLLTPWDSTFITRQYSLIGDLKRLPGIEGAAFSTFLPGDEMERRFDVYRSDRPSENHLTLRSGRISSEFMDVYQMTLVAGRNFTEKDYHLNILNRNTILNESATRLLGFTSPEEAVGKQINRGPGMVLDVVGVMSDFHQKSLHHPVEAAFFYAGSSTGSSFSLKVKPQNLPATIAAVKEKYDAFFPGNVFDYFFVDERFNAQYKNDLLFGKVFGIFAGFAIFIACLGLFGLSLFATLQRTKEIGVRKVLGASAPSIVLLLSKDFMKLVVIAFVIAAPVAWWVMHQWLQDFAYKTNISWWVFAAAGSMVLLIALVTVGSQTIKAAVVNPVKSLRTE